MNAKLVFIVVTAVMMSGGWWAVGSESGQEGAEFVSFGDGLAMVCSVATSTSECRKSGSVVQSGDFEGSALEQTVPGVTLDGEFYNPDVGFGETVVSGNVSALEQSDSVVQSGDLEGSALEQTVSGITLDGEFHDANKSFEQT